MLLTAVVVVGACAESDESLDDTATTEHPTEDEQTTAESTTTSSTPAHPEQETPTEVDALSGEAKTSGFEDLPIPVEATVDPESEGQDWTYRLPPSVSLEELDDWYHRHLPDGLNWKGWTWCRTEPISQSIDRVWHKPGTTSVMGVIIGKNDPDDGGEAFIILSGDESGPAYCDG